MSQGTCNYIISLAPRRPAAYPPPVPRRPLALALLAAVTACSDESTPPVQFGAVCGRAEPVRVLELPPGHQLASDSVPLRVGDRQVFVTTAHQVVPKDFYIEGEAALWSTDPCGEHPRRLAEVVQWVTRIDRWPELLVACTDTLTTIDPADGTTTPLLTNTCGDGLTDLGALSLTGSHTYGVTFAPLWLHPLPDLPGDPSPPPRELHPKLRTQIQTDDFVLVREFLYRVLPDAVFAIDETDTLVHIDLADGTVTEEATDVLGFRSSADGRHLLWQSTRAVDPLNAPVFLKDRETGTSVALGAGRLFGSRDPFALAAQGYAVVPIDDSHHTAIHLADFAVTNLPQGYTLAGVVDERRWLLGNYRPGRIVLYDTTTRALTGEVLEPGELLSFTRERAFYLAHPLDLVNPEGPVYRVDFTTADDPRRVAARASSSAQLAALADDPDARLLTTADLVDDRGALLLIDTTTADEHHLADHVPTRSFQQDAGYGPDHVVYSVDDDARSGIYVARLPAG